MTPLVEIRGFLIRTLARHRDATVEEVQAQLAGGEAIDSLEGVELIVAAEEHFGVKIEDAELTPGICRSLARLAQLIQTKPGSNKA